MEQRPRSNLPVGFPVDHAIVAYGAVQDFWTALGRDDDQAVASLVFEATRERHGWPLEGLAAALRAQLGVSLQEARTMGTSTTLRILQDGSWAFFSMRTMGDPIVVEEATLVNGFWWIVIELDDGRWQVWGAPDPGDLLGAELVTLPHMSTPPGGGRLS